MKIKIIPRDVYDRLCDSKGRINRTFINPRMLVYCGKEASITYRTDGINYLGLYRLDIDDGEFQWPIGMFDTKMRFMDESEDNS